MNFRQIVRFQTITLLCAFLLLPTSVDVRAAGYTLTTLASFDGFVGKFPDAGLTADAAGNFYGTTSQGGDVASGAVFKLAAGSNSITKLASFNHLTGSQPEANVIFDASGNLWGTTAYGGNGSVFKLAANSNTVTLITSFYDAIGKHPWSGLIADSAGDFYGTTTGGGAHANNGTIFKLTVDSNTLTTLASFNGANGSGPIGSLLADAAGNLFGTTRVGGANGYGTIFQLAAGSGSITTLASFNGANGASPRSGLIADALGNFYGTTEFGGATDSGTVFKLAAGSNTITTLATFDGTNGANPRAGLIADAAGNFYGTTYFGGSHNKGTVFSLAAGSNKIDTLASFNGANGANPWAGLLADANGNFYGTTRTGGSEGYGTIFKVAIVPEPSALTMALAAVVTGLLMFARQHRSGPR